LERPDVHMTLVKISSLIRQGQSAKSTSISHVDQTPTRDRKLIELALLGSPARLIGLARRMIFSSIIHYGVKSEPLPQLASVSG
jgi:hypothetical protein